MTSSGQPEFFKQAVRLEAEAVEEMKKAAAAGNTQCLFGFSNVKEGIKVFAHPDYNHAVLVLKNPDNIFKAISALKSYVKDVEKFDLSTYQRRKVLELDSFARFFEVIQIAKESESIELSAEQLKEIKVDDWVPDWNKTKAQSIMNSKILIYLHMKTFEHLVGQNLLAEEKMKELLGKLNELASRPNLTDSAKTVFKHLVEKSTLKHALKEAVDGMYYNFADPISQFIDKVQTFPSTMQPESQQIQPNTVGGQATEKHHSFIDPSPMRRVAETRDDSATSGHSQPPQSPAKAQDRSISELQSDSRKEDTPAKSESSLEEAVSEEVEPSSVEHPAKMDTDQTLDGPSVRAVEQPQTDRIAEEVQQVQMRMMNASVNGPQIQAEQQASYFGYNQVMHDKKLFGNSKFFTSMNGMEEISKKPVEFQRVKTQFDGYLKNLQYQNLMDSRASAKNLIPVHDVGFIALSPIDRLDLLVHLREMILKAVGGTYCKQDPLNCNNPSCKGHPMTWNVFSILYDELFANSQGKEHQTKPLSSLLRGLPLTMKATRHIMMERLLPFIMLHQDDLQDQLDEHLLDLTTVEEGRRNEMWFVKAQITILHLSKGVKPQRSEAKDRILRFLQNYLDFAGEYYLGGKARFDYQEIFAQSCALAEILVDQKKFLKFTCNVGNNQQTIYGAFLDIVVAGISPTHSKYQQILESLFICQAGSPSFKSEAIRKLKQDSGKTATLYEFLEELSNRHRNQVSSQLLDQWLLRLKQVALPDASESLMQEDPALLEAFEVLRFVQSRQHTGEFAQQLQDVGVVLQYRYEASLKNPATLAAIISRLEHKEHYLKFFSDAAEASTAFKAVFQENKLKEAFERFTLLQAKHSEINEVFSALEELRVSGWIEPLSKELERCKQDNKDPSKLTTDRLLEIYKKVCEANKKVKSSALLVKTDFYKFMLQQKRQKLNFWPLDQYRTICEDIEDQIYQLLGDGSTKMDEQQYLLLRRLLSDNASVNKISEILMLEKDLKKTQIKFAFYRLLSEFPQVEKSFSELCKTFKFVVDDNDIMQSLKDLHEVFLKDRIVNFSQKNVKQLLKAAFAGEQDAKHKEVDDEDSDTDQQSQAVRIFCKDIDLVCTIGNIKKLFDQFGSRENSHYNNLIFCRSLSSTSLDKKQIDQLEAFMMFIKKLKQSKDPKTFELHEWVRFISTKFKTSKHKHYSEKYYMSHLVSQAELLVEVSQNLLKGVEKGPDEMNKILQKSRIIFNSLETPEYSVFALMPNLLKGEFLAEEHRLNPNLINQVVLRELNSIKTQMAITHSNQAQLTKEGQSDRSTTFIRLIDSVISIKESLEGIAALGLVYDLDGQIKKEIESAKSGARQRPTKSGRKMEDSDDESDSDDDEMQTDQDLSKSEEVDYRSIRDHVIIKQFDLHIKLEAKDSGAPNIAHFVALQKILSDILQTGRERMVRLGSKFHQITKLTGRQKLLLCQYFFAETSQSQMDSGEGSIPERLRDTAESLCMFSVDQVVPPLVEIGKDPKSKSKKGALERMYLTADILEYVFTENNIKNQATDTAEAALGTEMVDTSGQCLYYYPTDTNKTIFDLLKALRYNQSRTKGGSLSYEREHASRFFLTKESTSPEELYQFIVRAAQDPSEVFYYILDLHLLAAEVAQTFLSDLQEVFFSNKPKTCNHKLAMFIKDNSEGSLLLPEFQKNNRYRSLRLEVMRHEHPSASEHVDLIQRLGVKIVDSEQAGMGKSTYIAQTAIEASQQLVTINLSGDVSPDGTMRRVAIIKEIARKAPHFDLVLHIKLDMVENFEDNSQIIDQFLFEVCYLRCLAYQDGYVFLDKVEQIFLEMQNTCKKAYYEKISFLQSVIATADCMVKIPKLKTIGDLKERLKINYWSEADQDDCAKLCIILQHLEKFKDLKPDSTDDSINRFCEAKIGDLQFSEVLAQLLQQYVVEAGKKLFSELTFVLIRSWVRVIYQQICNAHNLTSLNLTWLEKEQYATMSALRLSIFRTLIDCSIKLNWGAATHIRKQNEGVAEVVSEMRDKPASMHEQVLQEYKANVKEIPEWIDSKLVNYLPINGSLNLIYSSIKDIPPKMTQELTELSGIKKNPIMDYDAIQNGSDLLFENLCVSLRATPDLANMKIAAKSYQGKGFRLTQESYAKILMIYMQAELNVPIVIMGPSGCGKTYMVSFIAECLLGDHFTNLTLHPGVTEEHMKEHILDCQKKAQQEILIAKEANLQASAQWRNEHAAWQAAMKEWESAKAANPTNPTQQSPIEPSKPAEIKPRKVWLLFDEFNTSHLQCLVAEIMVTRTASFHKDLLSLEFPTNLVFVACCNPYKIEIPKQSQVGLANENKSGLLAHRVYPIPDTLIGYVWKFGVIKDKDEVEHIRPEVQNIDFARQFKIVDSKLVSEIQTNIITTITTCQQFFRKSGNENSVSLRDVGRFIKMFTFLMSHFQNVNVKLRTVDGTSHDETPTDGFEPYDALIVATQYCYILRLDTIKERSELMKELLSKVPTKHNYEERFIHVLDTFAKEIKDRLNVSLENAALNRPLKENLFVLWMCLLTKIPLLICGKPGTSKTLSINIIAKAFNIKQETKAEISRKEPLKFFGKWPAVTFRNFWGTETTTSESVVEAFSESVKAYLRGNPHVAAEFLQQSGVTGSDATQMDTIITREDLNEDTRMTPTKSVQTFVTPPKPKLSDAPVDQPVALVFDEIGLAEISKDNPLKVLHPWLEPKVPTLSFIGLSNWKLDASKMNRLLYVARPDMTTEELVATCESRTKSYQRAAKKLKPYFTALAESYVEFRGLQMMAKDGHNNFHGSRDFYSAISMFTRLVDSFKKVDDDPDDDAYAGAKEFKEQDRYYLLMRFAIQRSFSGNSRGRASHTSDTLGSPDIVSLFEEKARKISDSSKWADKELPRLSQMEMIYHNLRDLHARHLMIFTASSGIEDIIVEKIRDFQLEQAKLDPRKFIYLSQKKGRDQMIRLIMTQLPVYTRGGYTVIMKDMEDVYGCMYDLLNKNYFKEDGKNKCKLFYEGHEDIVEVNDQFKIVLLMKEIKETTSQQDLEQQLPAPLLNRFEKYTLGKTEFMTQAQIMEYNKLTLMFDPAERKRFRLTPLGVVHNLSDELLLSVIMTIHGSGASSLSHHSKGAYDTEQSIAIKVLVDQTSNKSTTKRQKDLKHSNNKGEGAVSVSEQSLRKLAPLFSRNLIVMKALCTSSSEYYDIEGEEFQKLFLETHLYDSLAELVAAMSQDGQQKLESKFVVFTYSPYMQIPEIIKAIETSTNNRFDVREASILLQKNSDSQGELIKRLVSDLSKTLVVYFKNRKDWKLMQHLRYSIRTTPGAEQKQVIFTAHYGSQDVAHGLKMSSPISFFSEQWRMVSIDDLSASRYEQCFEALEVPVNQILKEGIKVLTNGSKKEYLTRLARQALTEFIKGNAELSTSLEKSNRVVDLIMKRDALIQHLIFKLEQTMSKSEPTEAEQEDYQPILAIDLLRLKKGDGRCLKKEKFDYLTAFEAGNDLFATMGDRLTSYMSEKMNTILTEMQDHFPFEIICKAALLENCEKNEFLKYFEEVALEKTPMNPELQQTIKSAEFQESIFRMKYKNHVETLKVLVKDLYSGKAGSRTQFDHKFATILSDSTNIHACFKMKVVESDDLALNSVCSLTALFVLETLGKSKNSSTEAIHSVILQTTKAYFNYIKLPDIAKDYRILTTGVVLFSQIFEAELEVLSLYFSQFGMKQLETTITSFVRGFIEKGTFDIAKCAESLFVIQNINNKDDLKAFILQFETGIRLSKRLPKLSGVANKDEKSTFSREIFLSILNWIGKITDDSEFSCVKKILNEAKKNLDTKKIKGLASFCMHILEGLLTQTSSNFDSVRLIVDSTLGDCFAVVDEKSPLAGQVLLSSLLCERIVRDPDDTKTLRPIVLLAKVITIANLDQAKGDEVNKTVNQKIVHSKLISKDSKGFIISKLNFQLVNSIRQVEQTDTRISAANYFRENQLEILREMPNQDLTLKILENEQIKALQALKRLIQSWQVGDPNLDTLEKRLMEELILKGLKNKEPRGVYLGALLLLQVIYVTINDVNKLKHIGLEQLSKKMVEFMTDESKGIVLPEKERYDAVKELRRQVVQTPDPISVPQDTFDKRFEMFNMVYIDTYKDEERKALLASMGSTPRYQEYVRAIITTGMPKKEGDEMGFYHLLGIAANITESARESFVYSKAKLAKSFTPLINWEAEADRVMLKLLHLKQTTTYGFEVKSEAQTIWTKVYRCTEPSCRYMIPVTNCGKFGYHTGEANTKSKCPGTCGRVVGDYGKETSKYLIEVTIPQMEAETEKMLKNDDLPGSFKQEDASKAGSVNAIANFEEDWILRKYKPDLKNRNSAAFVYLMQHIFALVWKVYSGPAAIQLPPDNNSMMLFRRDIQLLKHVLQKDHATTMMFLMLFFDQMHKDVSNPTKPDLDTPSKLRVYLSTQLTELMSNFTTKLEDYNRLRSSVLGEATEQRLQVLNYVNGNLTADSMKLLYPELILPTLWLKPAQTFEERVVEEFLLHEKERDNQRNKEQKNLQAAFILDLLSKRNYLHRVRPILTSIMKLSALIGKRYDKRFSREETVAYQDGKQTTGEMEMDGDDDEEQNPTGASETTYKLNLASILDNSYFRSSKPGEPDTKASGKGVSTKKVPNDRPDDEEIQSNNTADISKLYLPFCEMVKKQLAPLISSARDDLENRLKLGCENASSVIEAIENLGNPNRSPLVGYCFPNTVGLDEIDQPLISLKTLVEALLSIQLGLISSYRDQTTIVPFMPPLPQTRRNFLDCSEEHFVYLDPQQMLKDLKAASFCEHHTGTNNTHIAVDTQIVAKKWADAIFSESEDISVTCNLNFVDQRDNNLLLLCNRVTKELAIQMETNMEQVSFADAYLTGSKVLDLENLLLLGLEYILTHNREKDKVKGDSSLHSLLPQDLRQMVSSKLLKDIRLRHCELLRVKILIFGYDSTFKKLKKLREFQDLADGVEMPTLKKKAWTALLQMADRREKRAKLKKMDEDTKVFWSTFINHWTVQKPTYLETLQRSVLELAAEFDCENLITSVRECFKIDGDTILLQLPHVIDKLGKELENLEESDDEGNEDQED